MRRIGIGIMMALMAALTACGGTPTPPDGSTGQQPLPSMEDFFPSATGTEWTYTIKIHDVEPLGYDQLTWPIAGDQSIVYASRKRYAPAMAGLKDFTLKLQVKGPAAQQGPLKYPKGVELAVLTDDLGVYQDAKQIFWAIREPDQASGFAVEKIVMFDQASTTAPTTGSFGPVTGDGYTHQMAFFVERPGTSIGFGKEPVENLIFVGLDASVPGYDSGPLMHFRREVNESTTKNGSILDSAFTEDMWFAKGKGMVLLEQKIGDKTSMVWTLANP